MDKDTNRVFLELILVVALLAVVVAGAMSFIALNMKNNYSKAMTQKIEMYKSVNKTKSAMDNQNKAIKAVLGQLQRVQTLRDVDLILARLKLKRVAVPAKEVTSESVTDATARKNDTREVPVTK